MQRRRPSPARSAAPPRRIRIAPRPSCSTPRSFSRPSARSSWKPIDMKYRKLGASDLEVSEISWGSWLTYGVGVEARAARLCLQRALDLGINFIDTANIYGRGAAETFLGEALGQHRRESY